MTKKKAAAKSAPSSPSPSKSFTPSHVRGDSGEDEKDDERPDYSTIPTLAESDLPLLVEQRVHYQKNKSEAEKALKVEIDPAILALMMAASTDKVKVGEVKVTACSGTNKTINRELVTKHLLEKEKWSSTKINEFLQAVTTESSYDYVKATPPKQAKGPAEGSAAPGKSPS